MAFLGSPGETGGGVIRGNLKGTFKGLKNSLSYQSGVTISKDARKRMRDYTTRRNTQKIRERLKNGF